MDSGGTHEFSFEIISVSSCLTSDSVPNMAWDDFMKSDHDLYAPDANYQYSSMARFGAIPGEEQDLSALFDACSANLIDDSVPPSATWTNLTTPGSVLLDTPEFDYRTSPLFQDKEASSLTNSPCDGSLLVLPNIPNQPTMVGMLADPAPEMTRTDSASSAEGQILIHPGGMPKTKARHGSADAPTSRLSEVAGVGARKRSKPLPPIVASPSDIGAIRRGKNTAAARKSRQKKVEELEALQAEVAELREQVKYWKDRAEAS